MSSEASHRVLMPAYLARFACIGSACEDTCCAAGWGIAVDAPTFARYQAHDGSLGPALRQAVIANPPATATPRDFARIALDEHGACPLLTAEHLCGVHLAHGPDLLSLVCLSYPRRTITTDYGVERTATLSCPEAARLALFDPGAMESLEVTEPATARMVVVGDVRTAALDERDPRRLASLVRQACADLVSRRDASLDARLLSLGLALRRLDSLRSPAAEAVPDLFARCDEALPDIAAHLATVAADALATRFTLELLRELLVEHLARGDAVGSERYRRTVDRLFAALQLRRTGIVGSGSVVLYLTARRDAYDPFMRAHPSVMDNFVRNQLYGSPFPYGHERGVFDDFALLVVRVATIRLLLIGVAAHEGGLTPELVVEVVQSAERAIGHDVGYHQHVLEVLRRSRALGLPILAALLAVGVEPEQGLEPGAGKRATAVDGGPAHDSSHPRSVLQGSDMPPSGGLIRAELRGLRQSFRLTSRRRLVQLATGAAPTLLRGLRARAVPDGTELAGE